MREGKTHHDNHNSFNTPPNPSGIIVIGKPMKPSSDRGIFFRLILSFTIISSLSLYMERARKKVGKRREEGSHGRQEEENVHHGIVGQWMTMC